MSGDTRFIFVTDPRALAAFYSRHLYMPEPLEGMINGRLQLTFSFFGGELRIRESQQPIQPAIDENGLAVRLPENVEVEEVEARLKAAGLEPTMGATKRGLPYVAIIDPVGIRWELRAHTK